MDSGSHVYNLSGEEMAIGCTMGKKANRQSHSDVRDTSSWHWYYLMVVSPFSRAVHPVTLQKQFRNGLKNMTKSSRCWLGLQIPQISVWSSICQICWKKQLARLKGCRTRVLVPNFKSVVKTFKQGCFGPSYYLMILMDFAYLCIFYVFPSQFVCILYLKRMHKRHCNNPNLSTNR